MCPQATQSTVRNKSCEASSDPDADVLRSALAKLFQECLGNLRALEPQVLEDNKAALVRDENHFEGASLLRNVAQAQQWSGTVVKRVGLLCALETGAVIGPYSR